MSEAKKPSIEEILAAARGQTAAKKPETEGAKSVAPAEAAVAPASEATAKPSKPVAADKGKMSVADILAAARKDKAGAATAPEAAVEATSVAAAKPAAKPASAVKPKPEVAVATAAKDTGSILAAARKADRPGPLSKEEAAKKAQDDPKKKSIFVPPKPEKPAYAMESAKPVATAETERRGFLNLLFGSSLAIGFTSLGAWSALGGLGLARFMFPNIRTEPPSRFKIGFPAEFPPDAVSTRFTAQFGVWVVNVAYEGQRQIVALKTVCTHLGCTPNWLEAEQKFKCPCHGSGFYKDGINFEGPAPRPLERYAIRISDDGQLEVDKSKKFQQEMGQWSNPACFVPV